MGEVLLTASMREVFLGLGESVLPGNAAFRQRHPKGMVIQTGQRRPLGKRQPARSIKAASQLYLHVALAFTRPEGQVRQDLFVQFQGHTHKFVLPFPL